MGQLVSANILSKQQKWTVLSGWACTITDGTGADALTPEFLLAGDAQTLCCCSCGYDDAVCLHLQVPQQFNILHRGTSAQAKIAQGSEA